MKYNVNYAEDKEFIVTAKDVNDAIDKCEKKERCINWIKDADGNILAERLQYSANDKVFLKDE